MRCLLLLPLLPLLFGAAQAQGTGTLAGHVTDAATGDPLPGANVLLEGTPLGAATDIDGLFRIIGIPVGQYDVTARFIAFEEQTATVQIRAGYTTQQDFAMEEGFGIVECFWGIGLPLINRDPSAGRVVTGAEIARLPVGW